MQKLTDRFKSLDNFGAGVGFTVKGRDTYGTGFGAVLTLFIYAVVFIYGQQNLAKLRKKQDTAHQQLTEENVVGPNEKFLMGDLGYNFAFGLWSNAFTPMNLTEISDYV